MAITGEHSGRVSLVKKFSTHPSGGLPVSSKS
jgi:hypothetical protein